MKNKPRILGLIPAKGGSERLVKKNIRKLAGRSLIEWAADSANDSGLMDRLILSTESEEIADAARKIGVEVPFMRPRFLAKNPYGVIEVALHALEVLENRREIFDRLIIMLPTAPFRTGNDIRQANAIFEKENGKFLMSVSEFSHTPFAAFTIGKLQTLQPCFPEYLGLQSQEFPKAYRPNGALHILDIPAFQESKSYFSQPLIPYVMDIDRSVDIDTEEDLMWAEFLVSQSLENKT